MTLGEACAQALVDFSSDDCRIWVVDGDLADSDGSEVYALAHPDRFVNAGIAEQAMVGVAAGLAAAGKRPFVFTFAAFLCYRALDQIRTCVAHTGLPVTLIGSHSGGCSGRNGKSHAALADMAVIHSLGAFALMAPADCAESQQAVHDALRCEYPCYIRLPRDSQADLPDSRQGNRWFGPKTRLAIAGCGSATHWALQLQAELSFEGTEVGVLHICRLWPRQENALAELLEGVHALLVVEDHSTVGGLASIIAMVCPSIAICRCGWPPWWQGQSGTSDELRSLHRLNAAGLLNSWREFTRELAHERAGIVAKELQAGR